LVEKVKRLLRKLKELLKRSLKKLEEHISFKVLHFTKILRLNINKELTLKILFVMKNLLQIFNKKKEK